MLSGRVDGLASFGLVAAQVGWLVVMGALGQLMTRRGRRRLEVQGG